MVRLRVAAPIAAVAGAAATAAVVLTLPARGPSTVQPVMPAASPTMQATVDAQDTDVDRQGPPAVPFGPVSAGYGAARTGPADVPLGFARSPEGAAAAVTAWLSTAEGAGVLSTRVRGAALAEIGDPGFVSAASARLEQRAASLKLDESGRPATGYVTATVWAVRGAYRVALHDERTARIEVWYSYQLGVIAPGTRPAPGVWRRATGIVRWDALVKDWRLSSDFRFSDGPDPKVAVPSHLERAEALTQTGTDGWRLYANSQE